MLPKRPGTPSVRRRKTPTPSVPMQASADRRLLPRWVHLAPQSIPPKPALGFQHWHSPTECLGHESGHQLTCVQ